VSLKREGNAKSTTTYSKKNMLTTNFFGIPKKNVTTISITSKLWTMKNQLTLASLS
jgi:hypothetical protein